MKKRDGSTGKEIPFSETENIMVFDLNVKRRLRHYRRMIGARDTGRTLDIGEPNWIGISLGALENTDLRDNFNWELSLHRQQYDTVYCFEVLEHVMNPLLFLDELRRSLVDDGRLYLSTPVLGLITWYQYEQHFSEYKLRKIRTLIGEAGLEIEAEEVFCPYPWYFAITGLGIRPILRVLFHRNVLFCLKIRKE